MPDYLTPPSMEIKEFWKHIKAKRKDTDMISIIAVNGSPVSDNLSKTEALNNQFKSVFT